MTMPLVRQPSGHFIDGWRVLKELGNGGFAVVYLVEKNGQHRALKVARHREASGDDKQTHDRVMRELTVLLMLMAQGHPNIVRCCGHGYTETGNVYLVLEYVDGWTFDEWKEKKHPTFREILRVIAKLAAALTYMHGRGILHRDLKLLNILIRKSDGEPIIIDFSCATYTQAENLTEGGFPPGTDRFRPPEQFEHLPQYKEEHRARYALQVAGEIFTVGAMLYELLTDPRPTENRPRETLNNPVAMPTPARTRNPRVPEALSDLVESMLARDPAKRPVDTVALEREVTDLLADPLAAYDEFVHRPSEQRRPEPPDGREPVVLEPTSKRRWPALRALDGRVLARVGRSAKVLASGAVAAVLLAATLALRGHHEEAPAPPARPLATESPTRPDPAPDMSPVPAPVVGTESAPVPEQKEGSTVKTQPPEAPKQVRRQKPAPGSDLRKVVPFVCSLATGCTGPQVRPEPFTCPEGAQRTMHELGWYGSQTFTLVIDDRHDRFTDIWLRPGDTVVGVVPKMHPTEPQMKLAPPGTQFLGGKVYVWPEKSAKSFGDPGRVVVKYERVKLPLRDEVPVCFVVDVSAYELKDGAAKTRNRTNGYNVEYWKP